MLGRTCQVQLTPREATAMRYAAMHPPRVHDFADPVAPARVAFAPGLRIPAGPLLVDAAELQRAIVEGRVRIDPSPPASGGIRAGEVGYTQPPPLEVAPAGVAGPMVLQIHLPPGSFVEIHEG